jgi:hypothetical protein
MASSYVLESPRETQSHSVVAYSSSNTIITLRLDSRTHIASILIEAIQNAFFNVLSNTEAVMELEQSDKLELKAFNRSKSREKPVLLFPMCWYESYQRDTFLSIAIRTIADTPGLPIPINMALLRNVISVLDDQKIKYEIW